MARSIFISYRRHDSSFFAAKLKDRLEQSFPGEVFLDVSGIDAGEDFVQTLKSAVAASKAVLVVIGGGWAAASDGRKLLGQPGDFVTEEVAAALATGIATLPLLIDGARMPTTDELPASLRGLALRHALAVSHERFDSDVAHVITALYKPLGIQPPSRLERILELMSTGTRFSQRLRDKQAWLSLGLGVGAAAWAAQWAALDRGEPQDALMALLLAVLAVVVGLVGRHSQRRRWAALGGMAVGVLAFVGCLVFVARSVMSLPREAWFEATQVAQLHASLAELPADKVPWSPRAPFTTPAPSVECDCLAVGDRPPGPLPYAQGSMTFSNRCPGAVTFVLSRDSKPLVTGMYPWFPAVGREFAVIVLVPKQSVRIAVAGTYGGAVAPWLCMRQAR